MLEAILDFRVDHGVVIIAAEHPPLISHKNVDAKLNGKAVGKVIDDCGA